VIAAINRIPGTDGNLQDRPVAIRDFVSQSEPAQFLQQHAGVDAEIILLNLTEFKVGWRAVIRRCVLALHSRISFAA
jgi:hypothetical protein